MTTPVIIETMITRGAIMNASVFSNVQKAKSKIDGGTSSGTRGVTLPGGGPYRSAAETLSDRKTAETKNAVIVCNIFFM